MVTLSSMAGIGVQLMTHPYVQGSQIRHSPHCTRVYGPCQLQSPQILTHLPVPLVRSNFWVRSFIWQLRCNVVGCFIYFPLKLDKTKQYDYVASSEV